MQKFKAVIFDLDGTLANTIPLCIQSLRLALQPQLGRLISDEEIINSFGPNEEGAIQSFKPVDAEKALARFYEHYEALHQPLCPTPFDGIPDLLDALQKKGVGLALVTGKGTFTCHLSLKKFGLASYFDKIECGAKEGSRKPEAIAQVTKSFGLAPHEVVYVGDSPGDVRESRKAGVAVVGAAWANTAGKQALKKEKPDFIFERLAGFSHWLQTVT